MGRVCETYVEKQENDAQGAIIMLQLFDGQEMTRLSWLMYYSLRYDDDDTAGAWCLAGVPPDGSRSVQREGRDGTHVLLPA